MLENRGETMVRHIISANQFTKSELLSLFVNADALRGDWNKIDLTKQAHGKIMATLFYEPSTRTRLSFESAMSRLGGHVLTAENAEQFSSAVKGESLTDTIRVVGYYADVIVLRHPKDGSAEVAAECSRVPIINAGCGSEQHPSQGLLDVYTIKRELGRLDNLKIALLGDLKYGRTIHSLAQLISLFSGIKLYLISPKHLQLPEELADYLKQIDIEVMSSHEMREMFRWEPDVVYMTRIQDERGGDKKAPYVLTLREMAALPDKTIVMHPLPRREEIHPDVDKDRRAVYFKQAQNGLYVRMALLSSLLR
jgi:aspartate carbamoyltransferase catalytic subunit